MPEVMINGPEGRIEARYHYTNKKNAPIALILHPHPQRNARPQHSAGVPEQYNEASGHNLG